MQPPSHRSRDLRAITLDGICFSAMVGLGETYLPAFALAVGMGEVAAGLLATLPMLAGAFLQLLTPLGVRALRSYRRWAVLCAGLQALSFAPLMVGAASGHLAPAWIAGSAAAYWAFGMATSPAWNAWVGGWAPSAVRRPRSSPPSSPAPPWRGWPRPTSSRASASCPARPCATAPWERPGCGARSARRARAGCSATCSACRRRCTWPRPTSPPTWSKSWRCPTASSGMLFVVGGIEPAARLLRVQLRTLAVRPSAGAIERPILASLAEEDDPEAGTRE